MWSFALCHIDYNFL